MWRRCFPRNDPGSELFGLTDQHEPQAHCFIRLRSILRNPADPYEVADVGEVNDLAHVRAASRTPEGDDEIATVHRFSTELLREHRVSADTYGAAVALLGERAVVELVFLVGYYTFISGTLNAFDVPVPEGGEAPFAD